MASTLNPRRFVLQADWELSVLNKSETFWAGLKIPGRDGIYFDFLPASMKTDQGRMESTNQNYAGSYDRKKRSLHIYDVSNGNGTTFYAPSETDGNIHKKRIYSMDVTAGGLGISSDSLGNLVVWETASFSSRRSLNGHFGDVYSCKFFPSGLVALSGGADMQLKIWSVQTGECARTLIGHQQAITDVGFIDRGKNVVSCSKDGTCRLWDCGTGTCLAKFSPDGGGQINSLAVVANSKEDGAKLALGEHESGTENKVLAVACENGNLAGFSMGAKAKLFEIKCDGPSNSCTFLNENTLICGTDDGSVHALDLRKPTTFLHVIKEDRGAIWSICAIDNGYWASFSDGSVCHRANDPTQSGGFGDMELSGSDCDSIYRVCTDGRSLYTCCRDAKLRKYSLIL